MHQGYQNSGAADLAQLQATMQAIEFACSSIQMHMNPAAAEETILSLSQSPRPYQACKYILENSQLANARFQAAGAIRDAALREWVFLEVDDKRGLISFCFHSATQHASSPEGYVQAKIASVAAQLIKRGWIEFSAAQKEIFFLEVRRAITGSHGLDVQFVALNFLESLVSEFSPSTSTAMALPREFHEQCRVSFELEYLKLFYCWAQDAAVSVSNKIAESDSAIPEVKVCTTALRLMLQILNWDFKCDANVPDNAKRAIDIFSAGVRGDVSSPKRTECNLVQIHTKKRNRLTLKRLNDLVFIKYNRTLKRRYNARNEIDPICLDNIDDADEWLTGVENAEDEAIFEGDLDFTWGVAAEASGIDENRYGLRANTSSSSLHRKGKEVATRLVDEDDDGVEEDDEQYNDKREIQDFDNLVEVEI